MKYNLNLFLAFLFVNFFLNIHSQSLPTSAEMELKKRCGTVVPPAEWDTWFNAKVQEFENNRAQNKTTMTSITIPVVVHVIHGGQSVGVYPNISAAQIKSQIAVLNKDFSGTGVNSNKLAATGFSLVGAANCMVTFCLAQYDPSDVPLAEPGIDRVNYNTNGWTNPASAGSNAALQSLFDNTIKPATIWDPTRYFNIWVSDENSAVTILGYATFPNGSGLTGLPSAGTSIDDGIWIWSRCFGTTGTLFPPYNLGRTATHETGHWLGLRHIGGDALNSAGDCNATDYCNDTPPQKGGFAGGSNGQNFGNPFYPLNSNECGSVYGNMFMNFMDYTDDAAMYLFTPDQNTRIQTALANGYFRNQLSVSSTTLCAGGPYADILLDTLLCIDTDINALNQSFGDEPLTYSWVATPSLGVTFSPSNTVASPIMNFSSIGVYTLTTFVTNTIGTSIFTTQVTLENCMNVSELNSLPIQISVSPNPSNGVLIIRSNKLLDEQTQIRVYNSVGELILKDNFNRANTSVNQIDLSSFPNGLYYLMVTVDGKQYSKLVVLRN